MESMHLIAHKLISEENHQAEEQLHIFVEMGQRT